MKKVCFVCSGNYYRSRFAEEYFNHHVGRSGLDWTADSRGILPLDRNKFPAFMSEYAVRALKALGIEPRVRQPALLAESEIGTFDKIVAINGPEHEQVLRERYHVPSERLLVWDVRDLDGGTAEEQLPRLAARVDSLLRELA